MLREATGATVYGPARERIPAPSTPLAQGDRVDVLGLGFDVIDVPGHTAGHIAYYCPQVNGAPLLFCGDTLFSGGCGRLFEGTPDQMWASLSVLAALPPETLICSGHEYTASNLRFAASVEPENEALAARITRVAKARAENRATVPSRLAGELATNPFLRAGAPHIKASLGIPHATDAESFAELRRRKDSF